MISPTHQKLIIAAYALTVILTIASLGMFFIEKPYKGVKNCDVDTIGVFHSVKFGVLPNCTDIPGKDPSFLMETIINLTVLSGIVMIILSALAFYDRKKHPEGYPEKPKENDDEYDGDPEGEVGS